MRNPSKDPTSVDQSFVGGKRQRSGWRRPERDVVRIAGDTRQGRQEILLEASAQQIDAQDFLKRSGERLTAQEGRVWDDRGRVKQMSPACPEFGSPTASH